jgi:CheY-like chemotaxis protein
MADVLVVEDEPRMRALLAESLADEGHRVEAVGDGLAGCSRCAPGRSTPPRSTSRCRG